MAANLFHSEEDDVCSICHEALGAHPTYTLPECQHAFHVHCIVAWFRHASATSFDAQGSPVDAPCPYCMNRGVNNGLESDQRRRRRRRLGLWSPTTPAAVAVRERMLKTFLRSPGKTPVDIQQEIGRVLETLKKARIRAKERQAHMTNLRKSLADNPLPYNEADKQMRQAQRAVWAANRQVSKKGYALLAIPVVPLIVPTPIDIN